MELVDTHCHIHDTQYGFEVDTVIADAKSAGVERLLCVGTDLKNSEAAIEFVASRKNCWATIGLHPHDAKEYLGNRAALKKFAALADKPKVVAVGETGLDYYYNHSPKSAQNEAFHFQLELAQEHNLPLIFHVREAFKDFFGIVDRYKNLRGVVHSFTGSRAVMDEVLARGFYMGLNGIMTFTKEPEQLAMAKAVPLQKLLLETDAPFLTPAPYRGTICQPKHVEVIAQFLSSLRGESLAELSMATTQNALKLFKLK